MATVQDVEPTASRAVVIAFGSLGPVLLGVFRLSGPTSPEEESSQRTRIETRFMLRFRNHRDLLVASLALLAERHNRRPHERIWRSGNPTAQDEATVG